MVMKCIQNYLKLKIKLKRSVTHEFHARSDHQTNESLDVHGDTN